MSIRQTGPLIEVPRPSIRLRMTARAHRAQRPIKKKRTLAGPIGGRWAARTGPIFHKATSVKAGTLQIETRNLIRGSSLSGEISGFIP
jgi:hypothetical protein